MTTASAAPAPTFGPASVPRLPRYVKLRFDKARERWLILAPERVLVPDETAVAVLQRVDGQTTVEAIAGDLSHVYAAPVELILQDSLALLQDLADRGFVQAVQEAPNA